MKHIILILFSALAFFAVQASEDPLAGEPEGERIALWSEGKVPGVEESNGENQAGRHLFRRFNFRRQ